MINHEALEAQRALAKRQGTMSSAPPDKVLAMEREWDSLGSGESPPVEAYEAGQRTQDKLDAAFPVRISVRDYNELLLAEQQRNELLARANTADRELESVRAIAAHERAKLVKQSDELLAACKLALADFQSGHANTSTYSALFDAIAKVEGN